MRPLVSVVVPAHNPGRYIEPCIRSVLRQSLPRDRFEVIFVDDGSTDGTGHRLDRLAKEQPHIRTIHMQASGAPGRPRNVGLEAAIGEYVQFLDADDELTPRALERLLRMAHANDSDIVLGKFASETASRRQDLFTRNLGATNLLATPRLADGSMGPTKLFRAELLREHEIRFREGWRQMEDQLFTLQAYVAARVISILGDEACYYFNKREDEGHISAEAVDPATHVAHLGEILDETAARVTDEALRDRFTTRFYRTEIIHRLAGPQFLAASDDYRRRLFGAFRELARERVHPAIQAALPAISRIRSQLLIDGDLDAIVALAERAEAYALDGIVTRASWAGGRLGIGYRIRLARTRDRMPLRLVPQDGRYVLDPSIVGDLVGAFDVTDELAAIRVSTSVVDRETSLEWIVPSPATLTLEPLHPDGNAVVPVMSGFVALDPERVGPGDRPLDDGAWDVMVRWSGLGLQTLGGLRPGRRVGRPGAPAVPALVGRPLRWAVPRTTDEGDLRVAIGDVTRLPAGLETGTRLAVRDGSRVAVRLPIATDRAGHLADGILRLAGPGGDFDVPMIVTGSLGRVVVAAVEPADGWAPRGRYELSAHLLGPSSPALPIGAGLVRDDGKLALIGMPRESFVARGRATARWVGRSTVAAARARALSIFQALPDSGRDLVKRWYRRARG
jgi:glycosyltransferase involved in cell wall biosynthesis